MTLNDSLPLLQPSRGAVRTHASTDPHSRVGAAIPLNRASLAEAREERDEVAADVAAWRFGA